MEQVVLDNLYLGILKLLESIRIYVGEWQNDKKSGLAYEKF